MRLSRTLPACRRLLLAVVMLLPLPATAHRAWMLPSATVLSGENPWVTVDAAISNDLFYFEHMPMPLDGLLITAPDGSRAEAENQARGRYRSTFDFQLKQAGTYRVAVAGDTMMASWQQDGQPRRWRGSREAFAREVPATAEGLRVTFGQRRVEFFVTRGAPTDRALQPTNEGLELVPVTHPNDLVAGEPARFRLLLDGKPATGVEVSVIAGGIRYRDNLGETKVKADEAGLIEVRWQGPGMYWLSGSVRDDRSGIPNVQRNASYVATFEVLP
ncbi:ABC transporter permease [Siccirubricoccus deserti]|uniref:DUF4198 domain-containing protein n=1 Tax=Siccirubricoccus deserti TaxID=2013562 RepID=A0A9X0UE87_9PROT|nr:DUF4198 domain-containing protein [Siccirubricoccus deserti]MBC4016483.1 DUF4198 domain-containing protein [Siccirubricoccus deserti]GGC48598.1 ABC transporter permease [Siccirubricoccus deserti]